MERVKLKNEKRELVGRYFLKPSGIKFFTSGCKLLDLVLGGGYARGRMINIVGDSSTGKTLLAMEGMANFLFTVPRGQARYNEAEGAWDPLYAKALGIPVDRISRPKVKPETIEEVQSDFKQWATKLTGPGLYVLDSLDAVGDRAEDKSMEKAERQRAKGEAETGSYGGSKPKLVGRFLRKSVRLMEEKDITLIIVSQTRDAIGVMFGDKQTRSGGRALQFYASQVFWLSQVGHIKATRNKVERKVGVDIRAKCKKSKTGLAFRECDFPIKYAYGVDDVAAMAYWLAEVQRGEAIGIANTQAAAGEYLRGLDKLSDAEYKVERARLEGLVASEWRAIEERFLPKRRKY